MSVRPPTFQIFWQHCSRASLRPGFQQPFSSSWRTFTSSVSRRATAPKPRRRAAPAYEINSKPSFLQPRAGGLGGLFTRVAKEGDVVLFKSGSQRVYVLSAYGLSAFCFAYAVYNSNAVFRDPVTVLPVWQQALFGGICVTMSVMGTVFFVRTGNVVRSIKAVQSQGQPRIRFEIRRLTPFMKPYQFDVQASQVRISRKLAVSPETRERFESDSKKLGSPDEPTRSFFKAPVQMMSYGLWKVFISVRQVFNSEDFILMRIEGRKGTFRVDSKGFVDRDFLLLGDPVQFRSNA
ncbi:hypothetical protein N7462_002009 [Penicillium macrosclerotiorum]|uniref:uncharacterized protein n=1 Tax=Penicillium macrosclerotiorum TaxID=303699 RepID=UPI0025472D06|nr:uncharacterized protein N7462_002009 [Penicillium macrosclerotiorum]KAJ5692586.1 hypothetical protein N7462_002009 [Penicillium macrosclerotiorum]